jgi:hypothetical protein
MQRIRGNHIHQRMGRLDISAKHPGDFGVASSENPYMTSGDLTAEVIHRYLSIMGSYEDAASINFYPQYSCLLTMKMGSVSQCLITNITILGKL